ncbi:ribonuclease H-like domain-containing protein [Xylaria acuta]|nr:ribonuclease H-like domain-containing protein [Xylaria acuta]
MSRVCCESSRTAVVSPMAVREQRQALVCSLARTTSGKYMAITNPFLFTHSLARNVSERLEGETQTNQRAELTAVVRALELSKDNPTIRIFTDSKYTIDCSINWYKAWERNSWRKPNGDDVLNQDLVKQIRALIDERENAGFKTLFQWVKGHSSNAGNIAADRLAVAGAKSK